MATIQDESARITMDADDAKPGVHISPTTVFFHLTKGFNGSQNLHSVDPAVTAVGHVKAAFQSASEESDFDFRFLQIMKVEECSFFYAGRKSADGALAIKAHIPPVLANTLLLDNQPSTPPWASADRFTKDGTEARNVMRDHPQLKVQRTLQHKITEKSMFLFHVIDRRSFLTVFTREGPSKARRYLAFFEWRFEHNVKFNWRKNEPLVAASSSSFKVTQKPTVGVPTLETYKPQLDQPTGPDANTAMHKAILNAVTSADPARKDLPRWFANVPGDFFA